MEIAYLVNQGLKRRTNQDFAATFKNTSGQTLAIVADGMGGHLAGDVASKMAVEELGANFSKTHFTQEESATRWFIQQLQEENERIYNKGQEEAKFFGMGTTVVAVIVFEEEFVMAHVGDSRGYLFRNNTLRQITTDHSLVQELVNEGEITQEMARKHPQKNVVTRSVGMPGTLEVDVLAMKYEPGDTLLMCSDGLTNMVLDEDILTVLQQEKSLEEKATTLVNMANENGGTDNITVMLVNFKEGGAHD